MASVNKVIIIGNVGKDPEVRYNPSGGAWVTLSLATTRNWKNRESGERQEETEWHRVVFNDRLAEIVGEYVKKGRPLYVEGRLKTRKWQDKEGRDTYTTEIIAQEMQLLGGRDGQGGGDEGGGGGASYGRGAGWRRRRWWWLQPWRWRRGRCPPGGASGCGSAPARSACSRRSAQGVDGV